MSFDNYSVTKNEGKKLEVDYNALNKYVVETANCESPEVLTGVVAGLIDLGIQEQNDAEIVFTGTEQDEADIITEKPDSYFKDGLDPKTRKPVRLKCYPQKAIQSVVLAIEFPEIQLDKGSFFGDNSGETKPLRVFLGGQYFNPNTKKMQVQRPTPLKIGKNNDGKWSFNNLHLFYKMAVAGKLIQPDGVFLPQDIDKLVGLPFQFELQIFNKESKGKFYYTEKVAFKSRMPRDVPAPELPTETFVVQFNKENGEKALKELRVHVINTIKQARNYDGSPIQKQLDSARPAYNKGDSDAVGDNVVQTVETPKAEVKKPTMRKAAPKVEAEDDGSPF